MNIWAFVKAKINQATPAPATPRGDRDVLAFLRQHDKRNDAASLPPAPVGMQISNEAMATLCAPSFTQRGEVAVELSRLSPPTNSDGQTLAARFPAGTWGNEK